MFALPHDVAVPADGRRGARRLVLAAVVVVGAAAALCAAEPSPPVEVTVRAERGVYTVAAQFHVAESVSATLAVLTDYERIPRFMPAVKSSVVLERAGGHAVVEQEAVARLMLFSKRIYLRLTVCADDGTVRFRDGSGRSFVLYEGVWRAARKDGYTLVTYELSARPSFDVPDFVLTRLLKRDAKQMIESLRAEIAARARQDVVTDR